VCLQVLEDTATLGKGAKTFLAGFVVNLVAASALAAGSGVLGVKGSIRPPPVVDGVWLESLTVEICGR